MMRRKQNQGADAQIEFDSKMASGNRLQFHDVSIDVHGQRALDEHTEEP